MWLLLSSCSATMACETEEPTSSGWSNGELEILCGDGGQWVDDLMPNRANRSTVVERKLTGRCLTDNNPVLDKDQSLAMVLGMFGLCQEWLNRLLGWHFGCSALFETMLLWGINQQTALMSSDAHCVEVFLNVQIKERHSAKAQELWWVLLTLIFCQS